MVGARCHASVRSARVLVAWLRKHEKALGACIDANVDAQPLALAVGPSNVVVINGSVDAPHLAPFERLAIQWRSSMEVPRFGNAGRCSRHPLQRRSAHPHSRLVADRVHLCSDRTASRARCSRTILCGWRRLGAAGQCKPRRRVRDTGPASHQLRLSGAVSS
jgi:hypothetical protein